MCVRHLPLRWPAVLTRECPLCCCQLRRRSGGEVEERNPFRIIALEKCHQHRTTSPHPHPMYVVALLILSTTRPSTHRIHNCVQAVLRYVHHPPTVASCGVCCLLSPHPRCLEGEMDGGNRRNLEWRPPPPLDVCHYVMVVLYLPLTSSWVCVAKWENARQKKHPRPTRRIVIKCLWMLCCNRTNVASANWTERCGDGMGAIQLLRATSSPMESCFSSVFSLPLTRAEG